MAKKTNTFWHDADQRHAQVALPGAKGADERAREAALNAVMDDVEAHAAEFTAGGEYFAEKVREIQRLLGVRI